jgi:hypothetical protein
MIAVAMPLSSNVHRKDAGEMIKYMNLAQELEKHLKVWRSNSEVISEEVVLQVLVRFNSVNPLNRPTAARKIQFE